MFFISKNLNRLRTLTYLIENPKLIKVYSNGGIITTYRMLNQPWFHKIGINTVIDIGANIGQFAITINQLLPKAQIYSFEPLPDCFIQLQSRMKNVNKFVAFNIGIGEQSGELEIENNAYSPASSFLKMTELNKSVFPFLSEAKLIKVNIERLDDVAKHLNISHPILIKVDVQGFEDRVLNGGKETIKNADLIIIETSFERLYEQQPLFDNIYQILVSLDFKYMGMIEQIQDPKKGNNLYSDSIFINKNSSF